MHLFDVQIADRQRNKEWMEIVVEVEETIDESPMKSRAQIAERQILFLSNHAVIDQFFVAIVSDNRDRDKNNPHN